MAESRSQLVDLPGARPLINPPAQEVQTIKWWLILAKDAFKSQILILLFVLTSQLLHM